MLRPLLIALLALAIAPAAASAAVLDIEVTPKAGADFGETHSITGKLTGPYGAPLVGPPGRARGPRAIPTEAPFRSVATAMSGLDGRFAFERAFDRNHQVRVLAPEFGDRSAVSRRLRLPAHGPELLPRAAQRHPDRPDLPHADERQADRPDAVLRRQGGQEDGAAGGAREDPPGASARARSRQGPLPREPLVRIPQAWRGRFRYASCFPYNAGMGNPKLGCPKKRYRF